MTEVVEEAKVGRDILVRTFAVQAEAGDGRTINVRVVPFNEVADVADPPDFKPYKEQFMPGAFARNVPHAHRIRLRSDHAALDDNGGRKSGTAGIVGTGKTLTETDGGYEGEFQFLDTPDAMTARELVLNGGYDGVSAEFLPIKSAWVDGVKQRQVAHLDSVALATGPAYSSAAILSLREEQIVDESMLPPPPNIAIVERCAELGIDLPEGMAILLSRSYTEQPWDGSAGRYDTPEAYCNAVAIDLNIAGAAKTKDRCHLPYKEPSGEINVNGVKAALSRIGQGYPNDATQAQRDEAKAKLEKILGAFNSMSSTT
jgi:HK97 family phage prohead protease